ncbi:hypothetical protein PROPHIGD43A-4_29 [Mycobacterium phage prophiGD43A-4]|nr:hypothetical protein PROPHIGD43A-4_29 [Mycobacterium phage prophiGD43A-4]
MLLTDRPSKPHGCAAKGCTCTKCERCGHRPEMHCRNKGCRVILELGSPDKELGSPDKVWNLLCECDG